MVNWPPKAQTNKRIVKTRVRSAPEEQSEKRKEPPQFTPLNITYDVLLPLIRDLLEFKWPPPIRVAPDQHNRSLRCEYHRDHGHETNHCQSLKFLVEKLILAGHLRRYIREPTHEVAVTPIADRVVVDIEHASGPRPAINFILGGLADRQYQSKKQRRKMLCVASVRARVNTVSAQENIIAVQPVDSLISFPLSTLLGSLPLITMHLYLLSVLTVLMCTGSSSIQAVQLIYYTSQPLSR